MTRFALARLLSGLALLCAALSSAFAAGPYPNRPITLIVPFAAGGGTDAVARIIGSLLEKELGQPVNVVNRAGGNGVVGHAALAAAAPDARAAVELAGFACSDAFVKICADAIQMHGGIAFTWDHPAHLYLRRARADAQLFGAPDFHRDRYLRELEFAHG